MHLTEKEYRALINNRLEVKSKYNNKKTIYDNHAFDSKKEANYYLKFKIMQDAGIIRNLELQKKYVLQKSFINKEGKKYREISYIADFYYVTTKDNKEHVVDVKGFRTDVYKLKKKLFEYKYGLEIEEV